jgi:hypothetical protein
MHALEADIARYPPEPELIVLPAGNTAGVLPTRFEHEARLTIDACLAAQPPLARQRLGRHLLLAG